MPHWNFAVYRRRTWLLAALCAMPRERRISTGTPTLTKRRAAKVLVSAASALDQVKEEALRMEGMDELRAQATTLGLTLHSIEITHEPMSNPDIDALAGPDRARIDAVTNRLADDPAGQYDELIALVAKHPGIPLLHNHLAAALEARGEFDRRDEEIEETMRLFPDYIFGFANYVMNLLEAGEVDRAREIMEKGSRGPLLYIGDFAPTRTLFHSTEVVCYTGMTGHYLTLTDRLDAAKVSLEMIKNILPEHPHTQSLAKQIEICELMLELKQAMKDIAAPRRKAASKKVRGKKEKGKKGKGKKGKGKKSGPSGG